MALNCGIISTKATSLNPVWVETSRAPLAVNSSIPSGEIESAIRILGVMSKAMLNDAAAPGRERLIDQQDQKARGERHHGKDVALIVGRPPGSVEKSKQCH